MANFSPGRNISLGAKYKIAREQSQENQNGAENTNRENRCIVSLTVWPFGGAQFSTFWDNYSPQDDGTEAKPVFGCISQLERRICKEREEICKLFKPS